MYKGIDVSRNNSAIDWNKVKNDGIEFAILKFGNIYDNEANYIDVNFERNYEECKRLQIPVGIYVYNYCNSIDNLKKGIEFVLKKIKGKAFELPIYLDMEDKSILAEGREKLTEMCVQFAERIQDAGYKAGIYANLNWFNNYLNTSKLENYSIWIAQYNSECTYNKIYDMWQYTSDGSVNGISGRVDMNYYYKEIGQATVEETTNDNASTDIFNDGVINCIYDIQEYLNNHYGTNLVLDNLYGNKTHKALVKALQTELNKQFNAKLVVDGIFGTKTKNACINVRENASGNITILIQMCLFVKGYNISMDKKFGADTTRIVKQFQNGNGLTADGIVGKNTFEKLFK